jgi:Fusaric acid resistance protein-like
MGGADSVVVIQMSLGGSLNVAIEYFVGTFGGAAYGGAIAAVMPHHDETSLLAVLALAMAQIALLAAMNPHFRVGPFTAVIVVLGATATHTDPVPFSSESGSTVSGECKLVLSIDSYPSRKCPAPRHGDGPAISAWRPWSVRCRYTLSPPVRSRRTDRYAAEADLHSTPQAQLTLGARRWAFGENAESAR